MSTKNVELLAPAGNFEALVAAVNNGADAVYLGGKAFGARYYASNFDDDDLIKATRFIHQRNKKIYVTVNTLLSDQELEQAAYYLKFLYEIGVDAVIVQDIGLLKMLRELFPKLEVHASTQMTINNAAGINFLEQNGVARVVLAREVSLENIRLIKQKSNLELETFVHGALCVCYSGQCLMSSMIGGRSGNRGKCAQPCRMKYQLTDINGKKIELGNAGEHLLSPKDLNTIDFIPEIIEAGVTSLKIEGRMKRPEYVATVTRIYRTALERYYSDKDAFTITEQEHKDLAQIFNRDFTPGYYKNHQGADLMSYNRPNNRGLFLGRISKVYPKKNLAAIKLVEELHIGDGLEIWVTRGGRKGLTVGKIWVNGKIVSKAEANKEATIEIKDKVLAGDRVFKTHDAKLMEGAQKSYQDLEHDLRSPVEMEVLAKVGSPLLLKVKDVEGNVACAETSFIVEKAKKRPLTSEVVRAQLERLGNTPYFLAELSCSLHGEVMVPLSELNNVRRKAIAKLEEQNKKAVSIAIDEKMIHDYLQAKSYSAKSKPNSPILSVFVGSAEGGLKAIAAGATRIYLSAEPLRSLKEEQVSFQKFLEQALANHVQVIVALPRIWNQKEEPKVLKLIKKYEGKEITGFLVGNLGTLELLKACKSTKRIFIDHSLNVFNSLAFNFFQKLGQIKSVTLSPEMTFEQLSELNVSTKTERECIVHGYLPLMISEYCAVGALIGGKNSLNSCTRPCLGEHYGIKDRLNLVFPVEMEGCRMYIYNSKELCLIDDLERFKDYQVSSLRIEARRYSLEEIETVVKSYQKGLEILQGGGNKKEVLTKLKAKLECRKNDTYTKGHYYRGVL